MARTTILTSSHFPYFPVKVVIKKHSVKVEALVDTGFDGEIILPPGLVTNGELPLPVTEPVPSSTPTSSPREDDYIYSCTQDSDCVSVGCVCNQPQAAVNKKYVNDWNQKYFTPPKSCLAVMCFHTPKCINNKCQLGKKGKS